MKIALYTSAESHIMAPLIALLDSYNVSFEVNPHSTAGFDYALSFGGDGTFLSSVRKMGRECIPIIGINSGRLGFLSTVSKDCAEKAIHELVSGNFHTVKRSMIKIIAQGIPEGIPHRALNEFALQKNGTAMIMVDVCIDSQPVGSYWADGIIVSTPTGSTAYSMSAGGAILTPECRNFIISPIAPHNLNIRPLVVPDSSRILLTVTSRASCAAIATIDNREYKVVNGASFELCRSKYELETIHLKENTYYQTLREKLLWGIDLRG